MNPDGAHQTRLTHNVFQDLGGDWAPDGSKIVFTSPRNGSWDLYTIRPDGTDLTQLTDTLNTEWAPSWSPDGSRVAYTLANWRRGWEDIAVINVDDAVQTRFVMRGSLELEPDWQPP
jgi:Tol biopolymer transport system component